MTCRHVQKFRDAYLDDELSPSLTAEIHAHILQCPACQREVEMIRVSGNVIANDDAEPALPMDFANRVVASLPNVGTGSMSGLLTRRARRRRFWRAVAGMSLPVAAALLFFLVLVWPAATGDRRPPAVAGATAVSAVGAGDVVESTLNMLEETRQAAEGVNRIVGYSIAEAQENVRKQLDKTPKPSVSITDILVDPITGLLDAAVHEASDQAGEQEVVRF
ncbi:MAG: zf-HC2 domain-containing protein [Planctomycetota bacterium]